MKKLINISLLLLLILALSAFFTSCNLENTPPNTEIPPAGNEGSSTYTVKTESDTDDYGLAGSYTIYDEQFFSIGERVSLSATVNEGYNFEGWYINDVCISKDLNCEFTMKNYSVIIKAVYSSYTVSTSCHSDLEGTAGSYTKINSQKVSVGKTIELSASVNRGYNFEGWYINGICVSEELDYTYTMRKESVNITPVFSYYTISTSATSEDSRGWEDNAFNAGTFTKYSGEKLSAGETVLLKATAKEGYNFMGWFINGVCVSTNPEYTYTMEKKNVSVVACYNYYVLETFGVYKMNGVHFKFNDQSSVLNNVYIEEKISVGKVLTVTAKPIDGYEFVGWGTRDGVLANDLSYTFSMPNQDLELWAYYVLL